MTNRHILILASVLSLLRGEVTPRGIAERFGVTEAQVLRWKDIFEIAGMLALAQVLGGRTKGTPDRCQTDPDDGGEPTTFPSGHWTTPACDDPTIC